MSHVPKISIFCKCFSVFLTTVNLVNSLFFIKLISMNSCFHTHSRAGLAGDSIWTCGICLEVTARSTVQQRDQKFSLHNFYRMHWLTSAWLKSINNPSWFFYACKWPKIILQVKKKKKALFYWLLLMTFCFLFHYLYINVNTSKLAQLPRWQVSQVLKT